MRPKGQLNSVSLSTTGRNCSLLNQRVRQDCYLTLWEREGLVKLAELATKSIGIDKRKLG